MPKGESLNAKTPRINPPALYKDPKQVEKALADIRRYPTVSIPTGGIAMGMGQTLAYKAAAEGTLPTIQVGKRRKVLSSKLCAMLGLSTETTQVAA